MDSTVMRALRPKITPKAALRMHVQHMTGIAVTTSTLGMLWWTTYFEVWAKVMLPEGRG